MNPVRWLIQPEQFETATHINGIASAVDRLRDLQDAIYEAGMDYSMFSMGDHYAGNFSHFHASTPVLFLGTLRSAKRIRNQGPWWPGAWCDLEALRCASYYPLLGDLLVNADYMMVPWHELKRKWPLIRNLFLTQYESKDVFIRPDSGDKGFTGFVLCEEESAEFFDSQYAYTGDQMRIADLCVVAPAKNITAEVRTFIGQGRVISASYYRKDKAQYWNRDVPQEAVAVAETAAKAMGSNCDPMYVIDVALVDDIWKVLELNSFSCSGVYDCDLVPIVNLAAQLVLENTL